MVAPDAQSTQPHARVREQPEAPAKEARLERTVPKQCVICWECFDGYGKQLNKHAVLMPAGARKTFHQSLGTEASSALGVCTECSASVANGRTNESSRKTLVQLALRALWPRLFYFRHPDVNKDGGHLLLHAALELLIPDQGKGSVWFRANVSSSVLLAAVQRLGSVTLAREPGDDGAQGHASLVDALADLVPDAKLREHVIDLLVGAAQYVLIVDSLRAPTPPLSSRTGSAQLGRRSAGATRASRARRRRGAR